MNALRLLLFLLTFGATLSPVRAAETVRVDVDWRTPVGVSRFQTGVTHAQFSLDASGDAASVARARKLLRAASHFQNQHIMGWGADSPEPSPGVYKWDDLDRRLTLIRETGGTPVITLCGAPDWMKGGQAGKTDWSKLETAPMPEHFADFAALAQQVARRYPDVRYYQIWNEFKGFWDAKANNWNYRAYTELYNQVYDALKAVNPALQVGGPYFVVEGTGSARGDWATEKPIRARQWEILNYWLTHKHGADFLTLDRGIIDFHDHNHYTNAETMRLTHFFGDVARQVREKTNLPLWWAEYYGSSGSDRAFVAAQYASILKSMIEAGTRVALLWQPQASDGDGLTRNLFADTRKPNGGQPFPLFDVMRVIHERFGPGARLYKSVSSSQDVEAMACASGVLLINQRPAPVRVSLNGRAVPLARYQVRFVRK